MKKEILYIGHLDGDRVQSLEDHLSGVAKLAAEFASPMGLSAEAKLLGENHDIGKSSQDFQLYIEGKKKSRVDHSTAGAQLLGREKRLGPFAGIGAFCIAGHHSGLLNGGSKIDEAGESTLMGRMKKKVPEIDATFQHFSIGETSPQHLFSHMNPKNPMDCMLLTRMLFSCLVDADFLDTEEFMNGGKKNRGHFSTCQALAERFWKELEKRGFLTPKNELNRKRYEILKICMQKGEGSPGLYSLTVPTGGGKTISSMAFAMKQAERQGKRRIIYVIPYLSIIEQTAEIFKSMLGEEAVLESHSNVQYDDDETADEEKRALAEKRKLSAENWDAPIIITTNEQFFESLYANRTSKCRKLHNIAESVIIFDEAQMLPVDFLKPCLTAVEELVKYYGCTAVLCSATQPELGKYMSEKPKEIMEHIPELYEFFRRVNCRVDGEMDYADVAEAMREKGQALCIASTKKEAEQLFQALDDSEALYISTALCPAHRKKLIRDIKERLRKGEDCRVVSTSVISVGVDIDFPVVYLEYTGLDGLIQGAGRCNREGKKTAEESVAHIFWTEKGKASPFMQKEKQVTDVLRQNYADAELMSPAAIRDYFKKWYQSNEANLDYKEIENLSKTLSFAEIGRVFHLIADSTKSVFIPYNEEAREIQRMLYQGNRSRELMRRAGPYIVNVRYDASSHGQSDFSKLLQQGRIAMFPDDSELAYLANAEDYDEKLGLQIHDEDGIGIMW